MTKEEILKKVLDSIEDRVFNIFITAWNEFDRDDFNYTEEYKEFEIYKAEILYLLKERCEHKEAFEGREIAKVDLWDDILFEYVVRDVIYVDELDNPLEFSIQDEVIENYLDAYVYIIEHIYSGQIDDNNLDAWMKYFGDNENLKMSIETWKR